MLNRLFLNKLFDIKRAFFYFGQKGVGKKCRAEFYAVPAEIQAGIQENAMGRQYDTFIFS